MIKTTIVGGILFLLPIVVVTLLLGKALAIARNLSEPVVEAAGITSVAGVAAGTLVAIAFLVILSFMAGLLARTRIGQLTFTRLENSIVSVLPQWRVARGLIQSFETESQSDMEVVMVPTDAGWCLAFVLEKPEGDWWTVFVPAAPQWTSGTVAFARAEQVKAAGLSVAEAILMMRRCGAGSARIRARLKALEEENAL